MLDDPALVEKYDQQRKVFTKQMQDKLDEYEAENRLPDEELSAFYEKMKQDVMSFVYGLEAEAEWEELWFRWSQSWKQRKIGELRLLFRQSYGMM